MAEEIDDNGFYREDFSVESDWEIFNAQLCELFQKWDLSNSDWGRSFLPNELFQCNWKVEEEVLKVKGNQLKVAYYKADLESTADKSKEIISNDAAISPMHLDLISLGNTFEPTTTDDKTMEIHWLARSYGLRRFVVLKNFIHEKEYLPLLPEDLHQKKCIAKKSELSFYLSAISVVAAEVCSTVPIFVFYDNFFFGQGITSYMRTNFDMVALNGFPSMSFYLSQLLNMFKEKLPRHCQKPALVSVRNTYSLKPIQIHVPKYVPFGLKPVVDEERSIISLTSFTALPHGYFPIAQTETFAVFTWPQLTDNMIIDSAIQTQFVPSKAPCGVAYQKFKVSSYLTSCIELYHRLITSRDTLESYVGRNFADANLLSEVANPLDQLTKTNMGNFQAYRHMKRLDIVDQTTINKKLPGPMTESELNQMIYYLFPDLYPDVALFPYETNDLKKDPHRIKSAVTDSLVHRLSCLLATCQSHFGCSGLAQLWATFTREIRILWDCCITIQGIAEGFPDTRTCLLHQKLQMLNVCIERRLKREQGLKPTQQCPEDDEKDDDDNDTEEEFYDCDEDVGDIESSASPVKGVIVATKPEGRLKRLRNLKLLDSEDYLYVPITQEPVPKTEDQLQDDADVMLKLGSDYVAAKMCSTLQSDAEAFKAANPNAKFEDFIRWYSPNDWEEYEDEQGIKQYKLSARMKAEDNTWQTVWQEAKPVPVSRQKRLFDDTNEGFKILQYLETRNLGEIYGLTVVPLLHSAILKLKNIFLNSNTLEIFSDSLESLLADLSRFSRDIEIVAADTPTSSNETHYILELPNPKEITKKIEQLEVQFYQYKCLERIFEPYCKDMVVIQDMLKESLRNQGIFSLTSNTIKNSDVLNVFDISTLIKKEYVVRLGDDLTTKAERNKNQQNDKPIMPQFIRSIATLRELRLCGAFTENTTFID